MEAVLGLLVRRLEWEEAKSSGARTWRALNAWLGHSVSLEGNGEPPVILEQGKGHDQSEQGCGEGTVIIILISSPECLWGWQGWCSPPTPLAPSSFLCLSHNNSVFSTDILGPLLWITQPPFQRENKKRCFSMSILGYCLPLCSSRGTHTPRRPLSQLWPCSRVWTTRLGSIMGKNQQM